MMAHMSPKHVDTLRSRLRELHYNAAFDDGSAPLVDRLLQDLLKSVESFHLLKQKYEHDRETSKTSSSDNNLKAFVEELV